MTFCMRDLLDGIELSVRARKVLLAVVESHVWIAPSDDDSISSASEVASSSHVVLTVGLQPILHDSVLILEMSGVHSVCFQLVSSTGIFSHDMCRTAPVEFMVCVGSSFLLPYPWGVGFCQWLSGLIYLRGWTSLADVSVPILLSRLEFGLIWVCHRPSWVGCCFGDVSGSLILVGLCLILILSIQERVADGWYCPSFLVWFFRRFLLGLSG